MGLLRLFLATLVVLGHMGINFFGLHLAVSAVVVFYILAGHVVSKLWRNAPKQDISNRAIWFYKDRSLRIFPLYFSVMAFSTVLWVLGAQSIFLSHAPSVGSWLYNILVIPLNYYMFNGIDSFTLVPPAWSLGVELQFYLLLPLLLSFRIFGITVGIATFLCYAAAQAGLINADYYGYRLLVGVAFIFLLGTLADRSDTISKLVLAGAWLLSVIYSIFLWVSNSTVLFNLDVTLGLACGLPLFYLFLKFPRTGFLNLLQRRAGEISYGMFLFHFPVMWMLQLLGYEGTSTAIFVILISGVLAWLAHTFIERPIWSKFRPVIKPSS
ncbi:acyltransferase family protein [Pseudomonas syringae]|uniref:acyltransferase family protein n=1 Tax=Pseudomonas syringae TaxID=317 RepID=UPI003F85DA55